MSDDRSSHLTIEVNDEAINYPDLNLSLSVTAAGFCKAHAGAWVTGDGFAKFLVELSQCEALRQGRARLDGMISNEFMLVVESVDMAGHCRLVYCLTSDVYGRGSLHERSVSGSFDLDSGSFTQMTADFAALTQYKPA